MTNAEEYFKGTRNDNAIRKLADFFSEVICRRIPRPEKLIEKKGFTNTARITARMKDVRERLEELQRYNEDKFVTSSYKKKEEYLDNLDKNLKTFVYVAPVFSALGFGVSYASKAMELTSDNPTLVAAGLGVMAVGALGAFAVKNITKAIGYGIYNKFEQRLIEKENGVEKKTIDKGIKNLRKEYKELSSIAEPLKIKDTGYSFFSKFDKDIVFKDRVSIKPTKPNNSSNNENDELKKLLKERMELRKNRTTARSRLPN